MGHKRAKKSVRDAERAAKGFNLAPSASARDDTPKGAMRIFNAAKVQAAWRARGGTNSEDTGEVRKRKRGDDDSKPAPKKKAEQPKIGEHETLGEYNRRVEAAMRGGVSAAIKAAESAKGQAVRDAKAAKKARREAAAAAASGKKADDDAEELKPNRPAVEFAAAPARKRLNDVAQAPPSLPRMRAAVKAGAGGGTSAWAASSASRTPLNAGQARLMEIERERVIAQYREIKARKEADREAERAAAAGGKKGAKGK
ncbi:hypothetical protein Q8F55_004146 [Vanrija albida]|uniref:Ribosome biogenesis protein NOP53 n=1 Tax=Vanrija albida TaxID=181172 RepID=A0ABR3Q655_9TREE